MLNSKGERELAYLVRINNIESIAGSDNCEAAIVDGWHVLVSKGEFKPNDIAIFFEIDSKLPEIEPFTSMEFLKLKHYKIKTQKFTFGGKGNFISQGLLVPFSAFTKEGANPAWLAEILVLQSKGEDILNYPLTKALGVMYAVPEDNVRKSPSVDEYKAMARRHPKIFGNPVTRWFMKRNWGKKLMFLFFGRKKDKKNGFPNHLPFITKSDEERIENCTEILKNKTRWIKTTKIDGTSTLFLLERKKFGRFEYYVCSRNVRQRDRDQKCYHEDNVYWEANDKYRIEDFLKNMMKIHPEWKYVALQGETAGCSSSGAKIQGDPHQFGELRFFGYNFITSDIGRWNSVKAAALCNEYGIEWVPIVNDNYILPDNLEEFKLDADGPCEAPGASGLREGYVYRNFDDNTLSFKNVSREYLLGH